MDSYDVIAGAVKDYWKVNYPQDVVAFFQQKYSWDDKWERCEELVACHGIADYENMTFLSDFCEGQTEVKDVVIIPLREVTAFYYERKIENHESEPQTNYDRLRAKSVDEMAVLFYRQRTTDHSCPPGGRNCQHSCKKCWLDWLKQEVSSDSD